MKKGIVISLVIISIILIVIISYIYLLNINNSNQEFVLLKSTPSNYSKDVNVNTEISFEFSQPLSNKETVNIIETIPNTFFVKEIHDKVITLKPNTNLKENTQYTIKISNIESINNEKTNPITYIFTTGKDNSERTRFIKSLPRQGDGFYIEYDNLTNTFVVTIQKNPYDKYKQNAINFLSSNNINTNSEQIEYRELRFLQGQGAPPG